MSKVSKNSRRPAASSSNGAALQGTMRVLITTGGGIGAYVLNPATGKNVWAKVGTESFSKLVDGVVEAGMTERLVAEVDAAAATFGGEWNTLASQLRVQA